jgi:tetratricopeptide (TPR) repeat protein
LSGRRRGGRSGGGGRSPVAASARAHEQLLLEAVLAHRAGALAEAAGKCDRLLALEPGFVPALVLRGTIAGKSGGRPLGIELLRRAVALDRRSGAALDELATLLLAEGDPGEAVSLSQRALRLNPKDVAAHNNLGLARLAEDRPAKAAASFETAAALQPERAVLHGNLGLALQRLGRNREAVDAYRRAVALSASDTDSAARLARLLFAEDRRDEALTCLRRAAAAQPNDARSQMQIADVLLAEGEVSEATDRLRRAAALDPKSGDADRLLGDALRQQGRFEEAVASHRRAIAAQPRLADAYLGLVSAHRVTTADGALVAAMLALVEEPGLGAEAAAALHYALGKSFDDLARYGEAMHHFDAANRICGERLRRAGRAIDRERHAGNVDRLIALFTTDFFEARRAFGGADELPVLVVGMIRSGTTLVEHILSSHPEVSAGGELRFWGNRGGLLADVESGAFDAAAAAGIAEDYCGMLRRLAPGARRVTDKMPTNFLLLGLIHMTLPRARIIHCRRNPVDTCLSIYMTPYGNLPDFAHDPDTIAFYWEEYARLMAHWRRVLPADIFLEIDYEELVARREAVTRQLVAFCGLDWDERCLRPEANDRVVRTPSAWQVRQPVHANSVARWRHYEEWLGPFRRLLPEAREPPG